ncbi:MAG: Rpn family recombination-promoting nuclease/putative transposase [Bacteroidales bacterium]|jgi:predicted transposase/invertase (TIGR01784 family)|nr:Rpn family recombination-promoting nuclease/putative transposase [Bacteroidales bacterium]
MGITDKYINPYTDFGFKKLFGTEANKDLLIDFLNQLITEHGKIEELTYLTPEQLGRSKFDRKAIYDLKCKTNRGEVFIVEMQRANQNYFKDRSIYYSTFPIQQQAQTGEWDYKLSPVYFIGILDFTFNNNDKDFHHDVKLYDFVTKEVFYDKLTYIYLEMPKFNKKESELETLFDKWLYVLKQLPRFQERPEILREKVFKKLFNLAEIANFTPEEADAYEDSLKVYRDNTNVLDTARAEGLKEGIEKGKVETAKKLLQVGISVEIISQTTDLSIEEIEKLK